MAETAAVGTLAIVSDIPGPRDVIDVGRTASIVEVRNAEDLATKMKRIREADYIAMGRNAAVFVEEKFNSELLCKKIGERKEQLLG